MNKYFVQSPKAEKEIIEAWLWYEEQQTGLGDRFIEELRNKIQLYKTTRCIIL